MLQIGPSRSRHDCLRQEVSRASPASIARCKFFPCLIQITLSFGVHVHVQLAFSLSPSIAGCFVCPLIIRRQRVSCFFQDPQSLLCCPKPIFSPLARAASCSLKLVLFFPFSVSGGYSLLGRFLPLGVEGDVFGPRARFPTSSYLSSRFARKTQLGRVVQSIQDALAMPVFPFLCLPGQTGLEHVGAPSGR